MEKFIPLTKAEMKKVTGGGGICPEGLCWNANTQTCDFIFEGEQCPDTITCIIVAKTSPSDCGTGGYITMPATQDPYAWCAAQPCCGEITCFN
ncbi:hypothetical protein SAMN04488524_1693 [Pedobacter africanus]|uniref:Uncharacterized protein n=2 Tax=Pedobacter africanus TaxID=151894 RepID=A0A1W2AVC0_9SPHI|nr:hypothetical protein SAMN04488524_1693 [Pedobacter africanus]